VLSRAAYYEALADRTPPEGTIIQAWFPEMGAAPRYRVTVAADLERPLVESRSTVRGGYGQELDQWEILTDLHPNFQVFESLANSTATTVGQTCELQALTLVFVKQGGGNYYLIAATGFCAADDDQSLASEVWEERLAREPRAGTARPQSAPHPAAAASRPKSPMLAQPGRIRPQSAVQRPKTAHELSNMYNESMAVLGKQKTTRTHQHVPLDRSTMDATGRPLAAQEKHEFVSDFLERIASSEHTLLSTAARPGSREAVGPGEEEAVVTSFEDMSPFAWERRRQAALECLREDQVKLFAVTIRADPAVKRLFSIIGLLCDDKTMPWQAAMKHLKQPAAFIDKLHAIHPGLQEKHCIVAALELIGDLKTWNPDVLCGFGATAGHLANWAVLTAFESAYVVQLPVPVALQ